MSRYEDDGYDDPRRHHSVRTRPRERDEPDYVREETYIERGKGPRPTTRELVFRGREDSIEDIERDFPPPSGRDHHRPHNHDDRGPRRARSARGRYDDDYDDDRYTDYGAAGAGGAAAGYAAGRRDKDPPRRRRDRDHSDYYSDESPPPRDRKKSGVGEILEGLGLGGIAGAVLGNKDKKDRDDDRSVHSRSRPGTSRAGRSYRSEGERSRSRSRDGGNAAGRKWTQAAQAALIAGAVEAFRSRKEPGAWSGEKGKRIATAAIGAGGIDRLIDRNPNEKSKRHLAEAVVGGLVATRLANGARSKSRGPGDRSRAGSPDTFVSGRSLRSRSRSVMDRFRGRSQSRGPDGDSRQGGGGGGGNGIKELVAGGALAAAGKAIYDRVRSKSRNRRARSRSSSADSYVPSRARRRDLRRDRRSPQDADFAVAGATRQMTRRGTGRDLAARDTNNGNNDRAVAAGAGAGAAGVAGSEKGKMGGENDSDSSSTTSIENKRKKMKGKEFVTAGLATIATIHAAHGVYSSMEAHEKRHRLVAEGEMSPEEARKRQTKAWVQDAAAIGIAALGIKGAFSEWKEMNEHRHEIHGLETRKREKRKRLEQRKRREETEHRERILQLMDKNPSAAMMMMQQDNIRSHGYAMAMPMGMSGGGSMGAGSGGGGGGVEQSGNPYAPRAGY